VTPGSLNFQNRPLLQAGITDPGYSAAQDSIPGYSKRAYGRGGGVARGLGVG